MKALDNLFAVVEDLLCWEHCRACLQPCRSRQGTNRRIKAVCSTCWSNISGQSPLSQWHTTQNGESFPIVSAVAYSGPVKKMIYKLKYDGDFLLVNDLAELLMSGWKCCEQDLGFASDDLWQDVVLVPIPLHPKRFRTRGFNQSELIAMQLSRVAKLLIDPLALKRVKNTEAQHDLGRTERLVNLAGAFKGDPSRLAGKTVVLIDDIYTSGATLSEAAQEALRRGASKVTGLTVASALLP